MKNPIIFIIPLLALAGCSGGDAPLYKDPAQPAEKRAEDLTSRMTLEQKVAQMCRGRSGAYEIGRKRADGRGAAQQHGARILSGHHHGRRRADDPRRQDRLLPACADGRGGQLSSSDSQAKARCKSRCSSESTPFTATRRSPDAPSTRPVSDKHRRSTPNS